LLQVVLLGHSVSCEVVGPSEMFITREGLGYRLA